MVTLGCSGIVSDFAIHKGVQAVAPVCDQQVALGWFVMSAVAAILVVLVIGLFVGAKVNHAREAHGHFHSYRTRALAGFGTWMKSMLTAVLDIGLLALVLVVLLFFFHIR